MNRLQKQCENGIQRDFFKLSMGYKFRKTLILGS